MSEVVQQFERQLGVRLPIRTTRQVTPTAEGEDYYQRALRILYAIDNDAAAVSSSVPAGSLGIDVHGTFARRFLLLELPDFLDEHPGIRLHIGKVHIAIAAYSVS